MPAIGFFFAICLMLSTYILSVLGLRASFKMFSKAWERVMHAPIPLFHDRTPVGL